MASSYTLAQLQEIIRYRADLPSGRTDSGTAFTTLVNASARSLAALVVRSGGGARLTYKVGMALRGYDEDHERWMPRAYELGNHSGPADMSDGTAYWKYHHGGDPTVEIAPPFMNLVRVDLVEQGHLAGEVALDPFTTGDFTADAVAASIDAWDGDTTELKPSTMESFAGENTPETWSASNPPTYRLVGGDGLLFDPPTAGLAFIVVWYEGAPVFQDLAGTTTLILEPAWFDWVVADVSMKLVSRQADASFWQQLRDEKREATAAIAEDAGTYDANHAGGVRRLYDYGTRASLTGDWEPTG